MFAAWRVRRHLARCWSCQEQFERISECATSVAALNRLQHRQPPVGAREQFRRRLMQQEVQFSRKWQRPQWRLALALATFVLLVGAVSTLLLHRAEPGTENVSLTAASLLRDAGRHEQENLTRNGGSHRVFRLAVREAEASQAHQFTVETWTGVHDAVTRLHPVAASLKRNPTSAGNDTYAVRTGQATNSFSLDSVWRSIPSVDVFTSATSGLDEEHVETLGDTYRVSFRRPSQSLSDKPQLVAASLTLRRASLHPVAETLRIQHDATRQAEYQFDEVSDEPLSEADLRAELSRAEASPAAAPTNEALGSAAYLSGPALALEVADVLDRSGLLVNYGLKVAVEQDGKVKLAGVLPAAERLHLSDALGAMLASPNLNNHVSIASSRLGSAAGDNIIESPANEDKATGNPLRSAFARHTGLTDNELEKSFTAFSNGLAETSSDALQQVTSMRSIVASISSNGPSGMLPLDNQNKQLLYGLLQRHGSRYASDLQKMKQLMNDGLGVHASLVSPPALPQSLPAAVDALVAGTGAFDQELSQSLAPSADDGNLSFGSARDAELLGRMTTLFDSLHLK